MGWFLDIHVCYLWLGLDARLRILLSFAAPQYGDSERRIAMFLLTLLLLADAGLITAYAVESIVEMYPRS